MAFKKLEIVEINDSEYEKLLDFIDNGKEDKVYVGEEEVYIILHSKNIVIKEDDFGAFSGSIKYCTSSLKDFRKDVEEWIKNIERDKLLDEACNNE